MADASQKQVSASVKSFLTSSEYSDLVITCGSDSHKLYKVVVCKRADFFARALKFGGYESQNGVIDLPEDEPEMVKLLIQYLYEGEYEPFLPKDDTCDTSSSNAPQNLRPKVNIDRHVLNYDLPHTCNNHSRGCSSLFVCTHHTSRYAGFGIGCSYRCQGFVYSVCGMPPAPTLPSINGAAKQLLTHTKMYEMADKHDVVGLKDLVIETFWQSLQALLGRFYLRHCRSRNNLRN